MKNRRFGLNLQLVEETIRFRGFDQLFGKKLQKVAHFVKKHEKSSILPKTLNFLRKLSRFEVLINFSEKFCKKWLISLKTMKNRRLGQNLQLFEQTITFRGFDQLFGKRLQKAAHFVKKHEKSSICPKHSTFRGNYYVWRF